PVPAAGPGRQPGVAGDAWRGGGRAEQRPAPAAREGVSVTASTRLEWHERAAKGERLEVDDLHVWFDLPGGGRLHAVKGVSFSLGAGERLGLVGESGCGKTTTVLALMGLLPANATVSGAIRLGGEDLLAGGDEAFRARRWTDVAMVFQGAMNALNPVKRVVDQIVEPMEAHGEARGDDAARRAGELLELVGISATAGARYPHEFSGGMR